MAMLSRARCPKCGAEVAIDPAGDRGTCGYCGTIAYVHGAPAESAGAPVGARAASGTPKMVAALVATVGALVCGGAFFAFMLLRSAPPPRTEVAQVAAAPKPEALPEPEAPVEPVEPAEAEPAPATAVRAPIELSDVDGDSRPEIVAVVESTGEAGTSWHVAVFDRRTAEERARTPALGELHRLLLAVIGSRLLVASENGELVAYDLVTGAKQWTTGLGERVGSICEPSAEGVAHVETQGERRLAIDLVTGRQEDTSKPCGRLLATSERMHDPRDRVDHDAPPGIEGIECGGVTVMGDENYRVADQCLARGHVNPERLDGMVGHRIWKIDGGWLVFGVRTPGTYVPMVGRLERGRLAWKSEVPFGNPLEAEQGGPRFATISGDRVVVAYRTDRERAWFVTAFAIADGARAFTVPVAGSLGGLLADAEGIVVQAGGELRILDPASGAVRARAGSARD